jgi:HlyD family secretion protein
LKKLLFALAFGGVFAGCVVAYLSGAKQPAQPPLFNRPANPYPNGIYANGIIESDQPSGENINVYPEVPGTVKQILVAEGQEIKKGTVLLLIDDSIQRAPSSNCSLRRRPPSLCWQN